MEKIIKNPVKSILVLILIILGMMSITIIETGTVGVKATTGKYEMQELEPGLHMVIPFVQNIKEVDTKVHVINYIGDEDLPDDKGVINKPTGEPSFSFVLTR